MTYKFIVFKLKKSVSELPFIELLDDLRPNRFFEPGGHIFLEFWSILTDVSHF